MRTHYHEYESLEHLLSTRLLPGGERQPIRFVVFGGTGAVGGASVMELCRMILMSKSLGSRPLKGEIYATGLGDKEIVKFVGRMYMALEDSVEIEKIEPLRHYRLDGRIDLHFSILRLHIPADLPDHVAQEMPADGTEEDLQRIFSDYFKRQPCPFLDFVEGLGGDVLHAAVVAIPLPSVATYTLGSMDRLVKSYGFDRLVAQRIKKSYLKTFIRGLAIIQQRLARHVVMAHTTAVGGMYRVDEGAPEIRLGFAHSALGSKLVEKKYFADELTQLFVDHGFDVLVTAAAIGIDAVDFHCRLPSDRAVLRRLKDRQGELEHDPLPAAELETSEIRLYRSVTVPLVPEAEPVAVSDPLEDTVTVAVVDVTFEAPKPATENAVEQGHDDVTADTDGADSRAAAAHGRNRHNVPADPGRIEFGAGKELVVDSAIRSGENGLFSVANCVALYNVMKVAIPEELAMVLVRHAVFGPERRKDWFQDKIAYYTETENSYFALRLLDSYPDLVRAHHGPFALQAYQALGSATHQARLHEIGLVMLGLRLLELKQSFADIPADELGAAAPDVGTFLWQRTAIPSFEDLEAIDVETLSRLMTELCELDSMEGAGRLLGYDPRLHGVREPGREKFLHRLSTCVQRYRQTMTSLGIPLLYRASDGVDKVMAGPYVAPLDMALGRAEDLDRRFQDGAAELGTTTDAYRNWVIVNNGFVDLRPLAVGSTAQEPGAGLESQVHVMASEQELEDWLADLDTGSYFTTAGMVAFHYRVGRLGRKVRARKVQLGTRETWKHLFRQDRNRRHLISPGLVETVRMYTEGLGKITGTEALWPRWGY